MPFHNGKRVSTEEWLLANGHTVGSAPTNPIPPADQPTSAPAQTSRAQRSAQKQADVRAAIASALGGTIDPQSLADLDVSGSETGED